MSEKCRACEGCGKVADDEDHTPWSAWLELPLQSSGAVLLGLVKPIDCPVCRGTGVEPAPSPVLCDVAACPKECVCPSPMFDGDDLPKCSFCDCPAWSKHEHPEAMTTGHCSINQSCLCAPTVATMLARAVEDRNAIARKECTLCPFLGRGDPQVDESAAASEEMAGLLDKCVRYFDTAMACGNDLSDLAEPARSAVARWKARKA